MTDGQTDSLAPVGLKPLRYGRPRFTGVVDANVLLSSIANGCSTGWRSRLLRMTDEDHAVLYAADHVFGEVYEHLSKFVGRDGTPSVEELRQLFEEEYLAILRFVTVTPDDGAAEALGVTDPDDVPTAQLAELLGVSVVFSDDRHLRDPGFAPKDWQVAARGAIELIDCEREKIALGMAVYLPARAAVWAVQASARRLSVTPWIPAAALLAGAVLVMRAPARRRTVGEALGTIGRAFAEQLARIEADEHLAMAILQEAMYVASGDSLRHQLASVLAVQLEPVAEDEVLSLLIAAYPGADTPNVEDVRVELVAGSEFVEGEPFCWQLGRAVDPPDGSFEVMP